MKRQFFVVLVSASDVVRLHDMAIKRFGGASGIMDVGKLESAVNHPLMIIEFGEEWEREIPYLAAVYFFHIIKNHPFLDGNKRAGLLAAVEFLSRNGFELEADFDELYQLALDTAVSRVNKKEIADFFKKAITKIR